MNMGINESWKQWESMNPGSINPFTSILTMSFSETVIGVTSLNKPSSIVILAG